MKPLRQNGAYKVTTDPITGQYRILDREQNEHILSDHGSVNSMDVEWVIFLDCKCRGEAAGQCFECGAISCSQCHGRCQACQKPICLQHSLFYETDNQEPIRLCGSCHDKISRKQTRTKVGRFLLSLIVQREGTRHD